MSESRNVDITHIGQLTPDGANARRHNERNIGLIADALQEVGAARSIVVDEEGRILAGNGTVAAAAPVGIERVRVVDAAGDELVAVRRSGLTDQQKLRLALLDNRTAELADWDPARLVEILQAQEADLADLFQPDELDRILAEVRPPAGDDPGPQLDRAEELRVKWQTAPGQLWTIGRHRLLCGDATSAADVGRLVDPRRPDAVVTDPPYGVGADYDSFHDNPDAVATLMAAVFPLVRRFEPIALTPGIPMMWTYPRSTWLMAWVHPAPAGSCPWGFGGLNPILVYGDDPYLKAGLGRRPDSVVMVADREGLAGHPTPKPPAVWAWLVERLTTRPGQVVLDPFAGSGTTLVVCEQLGRFCDALEIDPGYVAVCLERLAGMGLDPQLAG